MAVRCTAPRWAQSYADVLRAAKGSPTTTSPSICLSRTSPPNPCLSSDPSQLAPVVPIAGQLTPVVPIAPDDPATIMYTSGTSGKPKVSLYAVQNPIAYCWMTRRYACESRLKED